MQDLEKKLQMRKAKETALEWLKTVTDSQSEPSITIALPNSQQAVDGLYALKNSAMKQKTGFNINISPLTNRITFTGEPTLMYIAQAGLKFPGSEDYQRRFKLGEELFEASKAKEIDHNKIDELLAQGAYPDVLEKNTRDSSLHYAVRRGDDLLVTKLLQAKANPNIGNDDLDRPLHVAVELAAIYNESKSQQSEVVEKYLKIISLLCENGANPDFKNDMSNTSPYEEAQYRDKKMNLKAVIEILDKHRKPNLFGPDHHEKQRGHRSR